MSEQDKQAAKEYVRRSATQVRQAAKNSGRAAKVAAKIAAEEAGDVVEEINDTAEEAVAAVKPTFNWHLITGPMGKSMLGFGIAIGAAIYATHQTTKAAEAAALRKR
jgi:hypothetical protein